jgi:hypothetical protein
VARDCWAAADAAGFVACCLAKPAASRRLPSALLFEEAFVFVDFLDFRLVASPEKSQVNSSRDRFNIPTPTHTIFIARVPLVFISKIVHAIIDVTAAVVIHDEIVFR